MKTKQWSFNAFSVWLTSKAERLREEGFSVEVGQHEGERSSIRLRAENIVYLGELTVWDDGMAHAAVIRLDSGDFIYERDGLQLDCDWPDHLDVFFGHIMGK
jgi:hypothetical protein